MYARARAGVCVCGTPCVRCLLPFIFANRYIEDCRRVIVSRHCARLACDEERLGFLAELSSSQSSRFFMQSGDLYYGKLAVYIECEMVVILPPSQPEALDATRR